MTKPWIPLRGDRFQFPAILNNAMVTDDRTKELEHRQQEEIHAPQDRNTALKFAFPRTQKTDITNVDVSHRKQRDDRDDIGRVHDPIDG